MFVAWHCQNSQHFTKVKRKIQKKRRRKNKLKLESPSKVTNSKHYGPVNILPTPEGGGHPQSFRQKTIPDRREFDKLMDLDPVKVFGWFLHPGT